MSSYPTERVVIVTQHTPECGWPGPCGCTMAIIPASEKPCWARHRGVGLRCDRSRNHAGSHGANAVASVGRIWWDSELWRFRYRVDTPFGPYARYEMVHPPGGTALVPVKDFSRPANA